MESSHRGPLLAAYLERRAELLRYFRARLRSEDEAEELVQEIYLKIVQRRVEETVENPAGYLFRLGSNLMLDRLKQARRAARRASAYGELYGGGEHAADDHPAPEHAALTRQLLEQAVEAVRELPPKAQEAFRLHKLEGLSHAETAAAMGVSRSSVEKYLMASLKAVLAKIGRFP